MRPDDMRSQIDGYGRGRQSSGEPLLGIGLSEALTDEGFAGEGRDHWSLQKAQPLKAVQKGQIVNGSLFRYPFANPRIHRDLCRRHSRLDCSSHPFPEQRNYLIHIEQIARAFARRP